MLSILKMDLRRLFRSKSFYFAILLFLLFSGYCIYSQAKWQVINGYPVPQPLKLEAGLYSIIDYYLNNPLQYMYTFTLKNAIIIFGIYIVTFIANDYQSGYIKNSCMMCKNKSTLIWVKLCVTFIISLIIISLSFLLTTGLGYLFVRDFTMGNIADLLIFFVMALLIYMAFFTGISFLYRLCKTKIPSIIICVFFALGLTMVILEPLFGEFIKYTLTGIFLTLPIQFDTNVSVLAIIMCLVFIGIYHGLSILLFSKRDI